MKNKQKLFINSLSQLFDFLQHKFLLNIIQGTVTTSIQTFWTFAFNKSSFKNLFQKCWKTRTVYKFFRFFNQIVTQICLKRVFEAFLLKLQGACLKLYNNVNKLWFN